MLSVGGQRLALRAAADRPRHVQTGGGLGPAGQDEALQHRQLRVELVAERLEPVDLGLLDAKAIGDAERDAEIGPDVEELVLNQLERLAQQPRQLALREHHAERGVELVHRAEGPDPAVELRHARPVAERGLAAVSRARVDLGQANRLVAAARSHERTASVRSVGPRMERAITRRWISLVPS